MVKLYEGGLSRTYQMMNDPKKVFAVLSAERQDKTTRENKERTAQLIKDVQDLGYGFTHIAGGYWEEGQLKPGYEHSLFIPNIKKEEALKLAAKYNQDTVLYKDETGLKYYKPNGEVDAEFSTEDITVDDNFQLDKVKPYFSRRLKGGNQRNAFSFKPKDENLNIYAFEPYTVKGNHRAYLNAVSETDYLTDYRIEDLKMQKINEENFAPDYEATLANYLKIKPKELVESGDYYGLPQYRTDTEYQDEEWAITDDYNTVVDAARKSIGNLIDELGYESLNWDNMGGIEQYLDIDWFEEFRDDDNLSYAQDIHDSEYDRFLEEFEEFGLDLKDPKYELDNEDGDHSLAIEDFATAMKENQEDDPIEWYIDNFGEEELNNLIKNDIVYIDKDKAADSVIDSDGVGHILSGYDGKMVEHDFEGITYYMFRLS